MAFSAMQFSNKILVPLIFGIFGGTYCQQHPYEEKTCGNLYTASNFEGEVFVLKDRDQSVHLTEDQRASATGWNATESIRVASGCTMELCNETYFDGSCMTFEHGEYSGTNISNRNIASVRCTCLRECKCTDVYMKKSSCARAYGKGGCRTCSTAYLDLIESGKYIPEDFIGKVEALTLRKGCTLTLYPDEDFEGDPLIVDDEIVEDFDGTFQSYECECNDEAFVPRVRPPRPETFPPLINVPATMDDVIKMLNDARYKGHPGLMAAQKSLRNRRSSRNAYILLLGSTGAGKSSAINLLFDNPNVTKVGEEKSTTTDIHEFRIPVPVDELGVANSELRVIDSPGLGDTRGLEQDAKFLATLDDYLAGHEELKDRIPNVVLIFHKFHDNRFNGEGSSFVKMIRGFDSFRERITDENYSNVIFVLSHFCSETKANKRKPETRLNQFKRVIQDYSLFPLPTIITVAENKAKDQDLPLVNGFYKLPNNEYYPRNLFEKLELVTDHGGDNIGLGVFRTAFRDSDDFNVTSSTFKLVNRGSSKVEYYLRILSNAFFGVNKTEISQLLQNVWDESIDVNLRKQFPESLPYLQKSLNIRNVNTKEDIPKTTTAILELLTAIKHDAATRALLEKALNIKPPAFPQNTIAGFGFNVFKDTHLPTSPFQLGNLHQSDIGFMIPNILTCKLEPSSMENFQVLNNRQEYLQHRLKSLGVEGDISKDNFTDQVKPGYNIKELSFRQDGCTLSATREFRLFDFILNDRLDLTPEFESTVKALPTFNESDHETVDKWKSFFDDFGTHIVKSTHGGGSIEIQLTSNKPFDQKLSQALFDLIKFAEDMSFLITDDGNSTENSNRTVLKEGISHSLKFFGGDQAYHTNDLTRMSIERAAQLLTNWKKSLKFNPTVLTTEMRLMPISHIVKGNKKLGQNYAAEIERATLLLFNSSLKYVPPSKRPTEAPPTRVETPWMTEVLKMQQQSNQRMHELMMELRRIEQENEKRRMEMEERRMTWEREQRKQEQDYRTQQLEAQRTSEAARLKWQQEMEQRRQELEATRAQQQQAYQLALMEAQEAAAKRTEQLMTEMANRPVVVDGGGGSCLKTGTKILMADGSEKPVETLNVGDFVLDMDLNPTRVLGVAYEFLMNQNFFGFDNQTHFFTNSHLFVGPNRKENENRLKLYAQSTVNLYDNNPLIKYLDVSNMSDDGNFTLFHRDNAKRAIIWKDVQVFREIQGEYALETPIYFIQVDSPSGTYFANGYVCRHEIPPVENWPNTMSVMFRLMDTRAFEALSQLPYTLSTVSFLKDIHAKVADKVREYLRRGGDWNGMDASTGEDQIMTLDGVNMEECISRIFSSPTVAAAGVGLYATVGKVMSPYLDSNSYSAEESFPIADTHLGKVQSDLFNLISEQLDKYIQ